MKTLLVPIDFSGTSLLALEYAAGFAQSFQAKLHLLYVCTAEQQQSEAATGKSKEQLQLNFRSQLMKVVEPYSSLNYELHTSFGFAIDQIQLICSEIDPDLFIMGSIGSSQHDDQLLGHVSYEFSQLATCPLLLIPPHAPTTTISQMLFLDEEESDHQAYPDCVRQLISQFQLKSYKARFAICQPKVPVTVMEQEEMIAVEERAEDLIIHHQDMSKSLLSLTRNYDIDLICIFGDRYLKYYLLHQNMQNPQETVLNKVPLLLLHKDC